MGAPIFKHQDIAGEIYYQLRLEIDAAGSDCLPGISPIDVQLDCDDRTMVQPDLSIICKKDRLVRRGCFGAPDLVVEILSESTAGKDRVLYDLQ